MSIGALWRLLKTAGLQWVNDRATEHAGAIAFYMLFAMAPMILLIIAIAGAVLGEQAARGELVAQIEQTVGEAGAEVVQTIVAHAAEPGRGWFNTIAGIGLLIVGATGVLAQLKASLNYIWDVEPKPGRSVRNLILTRIWSLALIVLLAVVLMASLLLSWVITGLYDRLDEYVAVPGWTVQILNFLVTLVIITVLTAAVFKTLPDVRIPWRDVWVGAFVTALLFSLGRIGISLYLGTAGVGSAYGAAGSLVAVLIWLYYSAMIFLYGAELTQVYAGMYGKGIRPNAYAIRSSEHRKPTQQRELAA